MLRFSSKITIAATSMVVLSALSACSSGLRMSKPDIFKSDDADTAAGATTAQASGISNNSASELQRREARLAERERMLLERESTRAAPSASGMQAASLSGMAANASDMTPPNAKPGQCFAKVREEAKYRTVTEKQVDQPAGERLESIPAKYKKGTKRIVVSEASEKLEVVPATYKTVKERVMIKPGAKRIVQTAAVYETVTTKVLDKPARKEWKKGSGPIQRVDSATGEIMCLVEIPATYKNVTKRVLKTPASNRTVDIPAEYQTVTKRVVATPATTRRVTIPAKYKTITVTEEATPATQRRIKIPATYKNVTRQELVSEGGLVWREILCDTNMTGSKITEIQRALQTAGYNPGPIDGSIGSQTMKAVNAFQRAKGLPVDNYLNIATVRALGIL